MSGPSPSHGAVRSAAPLASIRLHLGLHQPLGDLSLVVLAVRREVVGQLDLADGPRWLVEVEFAQLDRVASGGEPAEPHPALAVRGGQHRHPTGVAALLDVDDVARLQLHQGELDRVVAPDGDLAVVALRTALAAALEQPSVLVEVAVRAACRVAEIAQVLLAPFEARLDLHHVAVGLVLGERQVEQVVRPLARYVRTRLAAML